MKTYQERVLELELEGLTTSDAQSVADLEFKIEPEHEPNCECSKCCTHEEHDHGTCLDCGEDITESLVRDHDFNDER